ncbi:unnamed protein product [Danaus chrysippus]|uniref:(African queen) hypothetical protein n=1 Tax=Danaus chrysippus TaxID=151541 RepID=A0A8J2QXF6_9NEOP|nr:unnamed protein product [Danaus chrysippus]
MDVNSYVIQLSRLDVPYSCSFSVRAESGSNIILVVQLPSEEILFEACALSGEQLVVYEFGETFGGYYGLIPRALIHQPTKNYTQFYTVKTTRPPTLRTRRRTTTRELILTQTETQSTVQEEQFYTIEVPIVNVSGNFQLGPQRETQDSDELFDFIYDVTPRKGTDYETSIMPLVQFSLRPYTNSYGGPEVRYDLDYRVREFTLDPREKGALVGHESWENIVQVAPVMAVVLNKTDNNDVKERKKRHIQSLDVEDSMPRNLTRKPMMKTKAPVLDDVQELVRIVELQDDEIGSRVVLRYLRHYVGPSLFNLCDYRESNKRQIFLFNSSRIVISINNFTLDQMMLVLTPAQTLMSGAPRCPSDQLECQIIGTRVCIDSLNSCDGVPNCGSNEIYDEDRLTCGTSHGVEHNVCIAAFTFLAVILTLLYITSYWLKRCVPRVSDAFFIYTESSENELFLESVMRSPNDNDDDPFNKHVYPGHYFEDDVFYEDILHAEKNKGNFCTRAIRACLRILHCWAKSPDNKIATEQSTKKEPAKLFSFTQLELQKITKSAVNEKAMQTSDNVDMKQLDEEKISDPYSFNSWSKLRKDSMRHDSELNLLRFSKESRTLSQNDSFSIDNENDNRKDVKHIDGELEIKNTIYELHTPREGKKIPVTCEVHAENKGMTESKRLRFDEQLQLIPRVEDKDSVVTTSTLQKLHDEDLDKIEDEENESFGRDFMRFWGAKGKKTRKKKHLPLRI